MKVSFERDLQTAFVLTDGAIRKIATTFEAFPGKPNFTATCSDGLKREFADVASLLEFDNARSKQILALWVWSSDIQSRASLFFRSERTPLSFEAHGDEKSVNDLKETVLDCLDGIKPWFSPFCRVDFMLTGWLVVTASVFVALALDPAWAHRPAPLWMTIGATGNWGSAIIFCAVLFGIAWLINRARGALFPLASFAIAQGAERYQHAERVRWLVLGSVVIPILISAFFALK